MKTRRQGEGETRSECKCSNDEWRTSNDKVGAFYSSFVIRASSFSLPPSLIAWLACYVLLIAAVIWWLVSARQWALAELATPQSIGKWQAWREDVRQQQKDPGPVRRRVPKSAEPPALVLMRDYFGVSLAGAILFSTVLYWIIAWFVNGIVAGNHEPSSVLRR
jgi:hypothetical protein